MSFYVCAWCEYDYDDDECSSYEYPIKHLDGPFELVCEKCHEGRINDLNSGEI